MRQVPCQMDSILEFDAAREAEIIERGIRDLVDSHSARGALVGLSGGMDSAVVAALAARALGKDLVHVSYLYDRDSEKASERRARLVADWLGLNLEILDIEPLMRQKRLYSPLIMRATALCGSLNRRLEILYRKGFGESSFMSALRMGSSEFEPQRLGSFLYSNTIRHVEAAFNARHVCRRRILEKRARSQNWLLLGAANRSEWLVGWFVKGGIDDLPLSPIKGLYKTQVRKLAAHLGIPHEVRDQVPSPDMMKGISDEFALGITYGRIDIVLAGVEHSLSDEEITKAGVTREEISLVREMNRLSRWKREPEDVDAPRTR